jgi:hypothetical protein
MDTGEDEDRQRPELQVLKLILVFIYNPLTTMDVYKCQIGLFAQHI